MKIIVRRLNNLRLRDKLVLSFLLVVIVPVMIVGVYLTGEYRSMALRNAVEQTRNNVERIKKQAEDVVNVPIGISSKLMVDEQFAEVVNTSYESVNDVFKAYRGYKAIADYLAYNKEVANIRFYIDNPTLLNNWQFMQPTPEIRQTVWYREAMAAGNRAGWFYASDETVSGYKFLILARRIYFPAYHASGLLVIDVNPKMLTDLVGREPFDSMIVDDAGEIVASNRPDMMGRTMGDAGFSPEIESVRNGTFRIKQRGESYQVIVSELKPEASLNGLRIVSEFSVNSILHEANRIRTEGLTVMLIGFAVGLVLIYAFSLLLSRRLLKLSHSIKKVADGEWDTVIPIDGRDEIGQLAKQFNTMIASIDNLMAEVRRSNEQKSALLEKQSEIRLKMLASQINPHFLFNALESIRMRAKVHNQKEIAHAVMMLGRLMRKTIEIRGAHVPLKDEIEMVKSYLDIQQFRHEERLRYELDVEPSTLALSVPAMIIQPLVENAVIHGLEQRREGGTVAIRVKREKAGVLVSVRDDGVGIAPDKLAQIRRSLRMTEEQAEGRIGIANVHMRLKLTYGEAGGLTIESEAERGTSVSFRIPGEESA